jgi:hypothetical protein
VTTKTLTPEQKKNAARFKRIATRLKKANGAERAEEE